MEATPEAGGAGDARDRAADTGVGGGGGMRAADAGVELVDVRGPRFSAALTCAVLAVAFVTRTEALLAVQVAVFAVAAIGGLRLSPYGNLFRMLKRRLDWGPPPATEPAAGPRFSQVMGLLFSGGGLVAVLAGAEAIGWGLVLVVVALSALLALTGLCVACELYAASLRLRAGLGAGRRS